MPGTYINIFFCNSVECFACYPVGLRNGCQGTFQTGGWKPLLHTSNPSMRSKEDEPRSRYRKYRRDRYARLTAEEKRKYIENVSRKKTLKSTGVNRTTCIDSIGQCFTPIPVLDLCDSEFEVQRIRPCSFCGARKFQYDTPNFCCYGGKVVLASPSAPEALHKLYTSQCDEEEEIAKEIITINQLRPYDRNWTIKITILRRGIVEPYSNSKGSGNMWKLILMDEQGTRIQAILFNDVIKQFEQTFLKENSYIIYDGLVKPVNAQYANVHKEFELILMNNTRVGNAKLEITLNNFSYEFTSFEDLQHAGHNDIVDVLGMVVNVEQLSLIKKTGGVGTMIKRNVTLLNSRSEVIILTLWGDLAKNEGEVLEHMSTEKPAIAVSKAKVTTYSAEKLVGCTISEFIGVLNKEGENNKFYKHLINCYGGRYMFFTRVDTANDKDRREGKVVVQEIFKQKESFEAEKESSEDKKESIVNLEETLPKAIKIERD
ncbi:hypothetical protein Vadar_026477 [Vaccinium darrowii]|uniref:Uncharacterized protein n=1 Tax=Vaccinium darrowii TaxID=229202 RepID=A0ACB7X458_9ERIC|nr:hypothetical protein Vadar_026477 [Vaccinium darrowii]